jgi:hypothetical protein
MSQNETSQRRESVQPVIDCDAQPLQNTRSSRVVVPEARRVSWAGWVVALCVFVFSRKLGLVMVLLLIIFKQYPRLEINSVPRAFGSLWGAIRKGMR